MNLAGIVPRLRLGSGLVLVAYVVTHFLNHSLGMASLEAMESGRRVFISVWRSPLLYWVVPAALVVHVVLSSWAILRRRTLRMSWAEVLRTVVGFLIPLLLLGHIVATRYLHHAYGVDDTYVTILRQPIFALILDPILMVFVWVHCCLGLYFWLRLKPWFSKAVPFLQTVAVLLPVLAFIGVAQGVREVARHAALDPQWLPSTLANGPLTFEQMKTAANGTAVRWNLSFLALLIAGFAVRALAMLWLRRKRSIEVRYDSGHTELIAPGTTVLEASRLAGIAHASVCGGRGRCSTCRVRIMSGAEHLPPSQPEEEYVLRRVGAPPNVRLACQLKPSGSIYVARLLHEATPRHAQDRVAYHQGQEIEVVMLFADLRGFTNFAEHRLPYDVVFILNQYFELMGEAIEHHGGHLDKFIGDGVMAIFGIESRLDEAASSALRAAAEMASRLDILNHRLRYELEAPLRIGIGLHAGPAIIGEMGFKRAASLTAIGDTVNTASRIEGLTKRLDCQLVLSQAVADSAGFDVAGLERRQVEIRGRQEPMQVYAVHDASSLTLAAGPGSEQE